MSIPKQPKFIVIKHRDFNIVLALVLVGGMMAGYGLGTQNWKLILASMVFAFIAGVFQYWQGGHPRNLLHYVENEG